MRGNPHLTLLQYSVIRRLEAAGLIGLARQARSHWSRGEPLADVHVDPNGVRAGEFVRANEQAERSAR